MSEADPQARSERLASIIQLSNELLGNGDYWPGRAYVMRRVGFTRKIGHILLPGLVKADAGYEVSADEVWRKGMEVTPHYPDTLVQELYTRGQYGLVRVSGYDRYIGHHVEVQLTEYLCAKLVDGEVVPDPDVTDPIYVVTQRGYDSEERSSGINERIIYSADGVLRHNVAPDDIPSMWPDPPNHIFENGSPQDPLVRLELYLRQEIPESISL